MRGGAAANATATAPAGLPSLHILRIDAEARIPPSPALVQAGAHAAAAALRLGEREFAASPAELRALRGLGVPVRVRARDAEAYYARRLLRESAPPGLADASRHAASRRTRAGAADSAPDVVRGSMGGYPTLREAEAALVDMASRYADVVQLVSIGTSVEGRAIRALCLTANASANCRPPGDGVDAAAGARRGAARYGLAAPAPRPATLYTSLTHSREPVTLTAALDYALGVLRAHAAGDASARELLRGRRLWFVPIVNPDGYEHNRQMRPRGGGVKRKNARRDGHCRSDADAGVDINRNFGFRFGANDDGSSPRPCAEDYRGRAPFSEPEAQALAQLMRAQRIGLIVNLHGWGNSITHPFGYSSDDTIMHATPLSRAQLLLYRRWAHDMSAFNGFVYGRCARVRVGVSGVRARAPSRPRWHSALRVRPARADSRPR